MEKVVRVAIITRTKDRPTFLRRAIESVRAQVCGDYVHLIVNNGGDVKKITSIVDSYDDLRIKIIHSNSSSNSPDTLFNKGVRATKSRYIAIHDDDDTWHPEFLQRCLNHMEDTGVAGVVVRTDKIKEELLSNGLIICRKRSAWMPHIKAVSLYRQCIENQTTPISFMYKRTAYNDISGYDDTFPVVGDWEFGIRFLQKFDIDYLDPGFALANYHHRIFKKGAEGNTSYAGNDRDRYYINLLMNKYLRQELLDGRLGIGYIMSSRRYNQAHRIETVSRFLPKPMIKVLKKIMSN